MEEHKVRYLVTELAKDIIELDDILKFLDITKEDYLKISQTRSFKEALTVANTEWQGATNTHKRVKLKAAAITEEFMLKLFFLARDSVDEPLSSKTKAFEAISRIAGLGALEPPVSVAGGATGNVFNLQINYSGGNSENLSIGPSILEGTYGEKDSEDDSPNNETIENEIHDIHDLPPISIIFSGEFEEL